MVVEGRSGLVVRFSGLVQVVKVNWSSIPDRCKIFLLIIYRSVENMYVDAVILGACLPCATSPLAPLRKATRLGCRSSLEVRPRQGHLACDGTISKTAANLLFSCAISQPESAWHEPRPLQHPQQSLTGISTPAQQRRHNPANSEPGLAANRFRYRRHQRHRPEKENRRRACDWSRRNTSFDDVVCTPTKWSDATASGSMVKSWT
jgi:hypothetical protein